MSSSTILQEMLFKEENKICGDCHTKSPRWASWNIGVFICIRCAGIHRNLGVHISKVKSVNLDSWTNEQISNFKKYGNRIVNQMYEANLPQDFVRPKDDASVEKFIRNKYIKKLYYSDTPTAGDSNNLQTCNEVNTQNNNAQMQNNKKPQFSNSAQVSNLTKDNNQQAFSTNQLFSQDIDSFPNKSNTVSPIGKTQMLPNQSQNTNNNNGNMFSNNFSNDLMSFDQNSQKIDQLKNQINSIHQINSMQNQFPGNQHQISLQQYTNPQFSQQNNQNQQPFFDSSKSIPNRPNQETDLLKDESKILKDTIMSLYNQPQMMPGYNQFNSNQMNVPQYGWMQNQPFAPPNMNQVQTMSNQINYPINQSMTMNPNQNFNINQFNSMQPNFNQMNRNIQQNQMHPNQMHPNQMHPNQMHPNPNSSLSNNLWN